MAVTYEPIQTQTLASNQTVITLSSIPATYTDLQLVVNATFTAASGNCFLTVNSDSGSNYTWQRLTANGSTPAAAYSGSSATQWAVNIFDLENPNTSPGLFIFNFLSYTNTSVYRPILSRTNTSDYVKAYGSQWLNLSSAINSITLTVGPASMVAGSTLTLYGIKAA